MTINRLTYQAHSVYGSWEYAVAEIEFLLKTYVEGACVGVSNPARAVSRQYAEDRLGRMESPRPDRAIRPPSKIIC